MKIAGQGKGLFLHQSRRFSHWIHELNLKVIEINSSLSSSHCPLLIKLESAMLIAALSCRCIAVFPRSPQSPQLNLSFTYLLFCASARTTTAEERLVTLLQERTAKGRTCCVITACIVFI